MGIKKLCHEPTGDWISSECSIVLAMTGEIWLKNKSFLNASHSKCTFQSNWELKINKTLFLLLRIHSLLKKTETQTLCLGYFESTKEGHPSHLIWVVNVRWVYSQRGTQHKQTAISKTAWWWVNGKQFCILFSLLTLVRF